MLYIVSTPIGNLRDVTRRAVDVLRSVHLIACEDTRHTGILLKEYGITTPTTSYFQHNRFAKGEYLLGILKEGRDVALVSDAGTPGILDPGYALINLALKNDIPVTAVPGPAAFVDALVLSGKPAHRFVFEGFLPQKPGSRKNRLQELARLEYTVVLYESPHRILDTLKDMRDVFGDTEIVCCRELTKKFEEIRRGTAQDLLEHFKKQKVRGEFVVVI
ncbi:MAG: 16S rRNA (cytidine(1402)-2'-O)-methyltransferase [Candidatus Omnitrophica bacterium]|nr:16S rRNA (cytidine(1402)-2'-O)-methyltransferase [Candidatus Omnitrophota bacterium]